MSQEKQKFSLLTIIYLALDIIILFGYFGLPWIEIDGLDFGNISLTMGEGISNSISLFQSGTVSDNPLIMLNEINSILSLVFVIIPFLLLISSFSLISGKFQNFNNRSVGNYLFFIIFFIIVFLFKVIGLYLVEQDLIDQYGLLTVNNAPINVQDFLSFKSGFYLIFLASVVGFFIYKITKLFKPNEVSEEGKESKEEVLKNKGISDQAESKDQYNQVIEFNLTPPVTLFNKDFKIEIPTLPATLGRNENEVDISIKNETISRIHCQILDYEDSILIVDKNSSAGTYINNNKLEQEEYYQLYNGDILKLGDVEFNVYLESDQNNLNSNYQVSNYQETIIPDQNIKVYSDTLDGTPAKNITNENSKQNFHRSQTLKLNDESKLNQTIKLDEDNIRPLNKTIKLENNDE